MTKYTAISAAALRARLHEPAELAVLDVREQGEFGLGHLFHAVNLPLSRAELMAPLLVPHPKTQLVLCDGGDGLAQRGADTLAGLGYTDIAVLDGGVDGWAEAGFEVYSGINVPSKAFGEFVEHHYGTPSVSAEELKAMMDGGEKLVILDSRPIGEYRNMSIPTAIDVPGAELAYRVHDLAPDPDMTVVVNCAGRTRSIIGAQSLINAGIPNKVAALRNGTMGWHLAGFELDHGMERRYAEGDPMALDRAQAVRERVAARFQVPEIDATTLADWSTDANGNLFLLDVRDPEEYRAGHLHGARSAPGGQLVQGADMFIGVRGARIVLCDDTGVRATMTAHWLLQMGYTGVCVLGGGIAAAGPMETGMPEVPVPAAAPEIAAQELRAMLDGERANLLDLDSSRTFRAGHIPGACWALRTRIAATAGDLPERDILVLTSEDGRLAHLAVEEAEALGAGEVRVLAGGTRAWTAAGLPLAADRSDPPDEGCVDVLLRAYDRNTGVEEKMQEYLDWEVALVDQVARDPDVGFRPPPRA